MWVDFVGVYWYLYLFFLDLSYCFLWYVVFGLVNVLYFCGGVEVLWFCVLYLIGSVFFGWVVVEWYNDGSGLWIGVFVVSGCVFYGEWGVWDLYDSW